jgi:Leu/Phe-tRNA-protein transferase
MVFVFAARIKTLLGQLYGVQKASYFINQSVKHLLSDGSQFSTVQNCSALQCVDPEMKVLAPDPELQQCNNIHNTFSAKRKT